MVSGGAWYCPLFSIDVKGGERSFGNRVQSEWTNAEECWVWMQVLPSMPKGEIVDKYWKSNECVLMVVVIYGNSGDGRIWRIKSFKDLKRTSSGGIAFLYAQEAQERDREPSDLTRKSRQLLDREKLRRCQAQELACRRSDLHRQIGSRYPTAVISTKYARGISHRRIEDREFIMSNPLDIENFEITICDFTMWS